MVCRSRPGGRRQELPHVFRTRRPLTTHGDGVSAGQRPFGATRPTRQITATTHTPQGYMRRAPDGQTPRSEALFAGWQVQDSNLRRHTPTDLQNVGAHALTCWFTTRPSNFGTNSPTLEGAAVSRICRDPCIGSSDALAHCSRGPLTTRQISPLAGRVGLRPNRRCVAAAVQRHGDGRSVRFRPDPALYPRGG